MTLGRRALLAALPALPALAAGRAVGQVAAPMPALVMGTGKPGGSYALYGPEWGALAQDSFGGAIAYRASGGAAANILLIEEGSAQLGMTTLTIAEQALDGTASWTAGARLSGFKALFPMFVSTLQIVAPAGRGIATLAGLAGQSIGVGPDGGSGAATVPAILASLGVLPAAMPSGSYDAQIGDMLAGRLAACAFFSAAPVPAIQTAALRTRLALIGFTHAELAHVLATSAGMRPAVLPAGLFPRQAAPVASLGTANFTIGAADLPDAVAAAVTLAALRHVSALAAVVPAAARPPPPATIAQGGVLYHPGALAALKRLGYKMPKPA